jgi:hypothetical protein
MFLWGEADRLRSEHHNGREKVHVNNELTQREESMTTTNAFRLASVVTAINVLVATDFTIAAIFRPEVVVVWSNNSNELKWHSLQSFHKRTSKGLLRLKNSI